MKKCQKKSQEITFFLILKFLTYFLLLKEMLFPYFCQLRRLVFDQSSPVQPISESRGGSLSVTE